MRRELEREFGVFATGNAALQMGRNGSYVYFDYAEGIARKLVPRADLLRTFRKIVRLYPANPYRKYAQETADVLERMVAEDKLHKALTQEQLAKLPLEKRIDELIFRLRDQLGLEPAASDILDTYPDAATPANQLVKIGYPAVPHLIKALGDKRFSRSISRGNGVDVLTVGDCATSILEHITGLHSYEFGSGSGYGEAPTDSFRKALEDLWAGFQAEKANDIIDWISSGKVNPGPLVTKSEKISPGSVKHAILIGALKASREDAVQAFIKELDRYRTDPVASLIRERLSSRRRMQDMNFDGAFDDLMREAKAEAAP